MRAGAGSSSTGSQRCRQAAAAAPSTHVRAVALPVPSQRFAATYLHKWGTAALPKPVDRDVHRISTWIAAVYQDQRFYEEPAGGWAPAPADAAPAGASTTSTEVRTGRGAAIVGAAMQAWEGAACGPAR